LKTENFWQGVFDFIRDMRNEYKILDSELIIAVFSKIELLLLLVFIERPDRVLIQIGMVWFAALVLRCLHMLSTPLPPMDEKKMPFYYGLGFYDTDSYDVQKSKTADSEENENLGGKKGWQLPRLEDLFQFKLNAKFDLTIKVGDLAKNIDPRDGRILPTAYREKSNGEDVPTAFRKENGVSGPGYGRFNGSIPVYGSLEQGLDSTLWPESFYLISRKISTCTDCFFSGHTIVILVLLCVITENWSKILRKLSRWIRKRCCRVVKPEVRQNDSKLHVNSADDARLRVSSHLGGTRELSMNRESTKGLCDGVVIMDSAEYDRTEDGVSNLYNSEHNTQQPSKASADTKTCDSDRTRTNSIRIDILESFLISLITVPCIVWTCLGLFSIVLERSHYTLDVVGAIFFFLLLKALEKSQIEKYRLRFYLEYHHLSFGIASRPDSDTLSQTQENFRAQKVFHESLREDGTSVVGTAPAVTLREMDKSKSLADEVGNLQRSGRCCFHEHCCFRESWWWHCHFCVCVYPWIFLLRVWLWLMFVDPRACCYPCCGCARYLTGETDKCCQCASNSIAEDSKEGGSEQSMAQATIGAPIRASLSEVPARGRESSISMPQDPESDGYDDFDQNFRQSEASNAKTFREKLLDEDIARRELCSLLCCSCPSVRGLRVFEQKLAHFLHGVQGAYLHLDDESESDSAIGS